MPVNFGSVGGHYHGAVDFQLRGLPACGERGGAGLQRHHLLLAALSKTLNIVGAGRVGSTLARGWFHCGVYDVGDVINSTLESARQAVTFIGAGRARDDMSSNVLIFGSISISSSAARTR